MTAGISWAVEMAVRMGGADGDMGCLPEEARETINHVEHQSL